VTVRGDERIHPARVLDHKHYHNVRDRLKYLDEVLTSVPLHEHPVENEPMERKARRPRSSCGFTVSASILSCRSRRSFPAITKLSFSVGRVIDSGAVQRRIGNRSAQGFDRSRVRQYGLRAQARMKQTSAIRSDRAVDEREPRPPGEEEFPRTIFYLGSSSSSAIGSSTGFCTTRLPTPFSGGSVFRPPERHPADPGEREGAQRPFAPATSAA